MSSRNIQTYYFGGNVNKRPISALRPNIFTQRDVFIRDLKERRDNQHRGQEVKRCVELLIPYCRGAIARKRFINTLRDRFDASTSAEPVVQVRLMNRFYSGIIDTSRMTQLCRRLVPAVSKMPDAELDTVDWQRFSVVLLRHMILASDSPSHQLNPEVRLLEILSDRSVKCLEALTGDEQYNYFSTMLTVYERRINVPLGARWRIEAALPGAAAAEFYALLVRPLALVLRDGVSEQLRHSVYETFWKRLFCVPTYSPHSVCHILPQLCRDIKSSKAALEPSLLMAALLSDESEKHPTAACTAIALVAAISENGQSNAECDAQLLAVLSAYVPTLNVWLNRRDRTRHESSSSISDDEEGVVSMDVDEMMPSTSRELDVSPHSWRGLLAVATQTLQSSAISAVARRALANASDMSREALVPLAFTLFLISQNREYSTSTVPALFPTLSTAPSFLRYLWQSIVKMHRSDNISDVSALNALQHGTRLSDADEAQLIPRLSLFCVLLRSLLHIVHDDEFYRDDEDKLTDTLMCFNNSELASICRHIRDCALGLIDLAHPEHAMRRLTDDKEREYRQLLSTVTGVQYALHERDTRVHFCAPKFWQSHGRRVIVQRATFSQTPSGRRMPSRRNRMFGQYISSEQLSGDQKQAMTPQEARNALILQRMPFLVTFAQRVEVLQDLINKDKADNYRADEFGPNSRTIYVMARRTQLYDDAFVALSKENAPNMRNQVRVQLKNWAGAHEAGIDGGGLFREFLSEVLREGFSPERGLFTQSQHTSELCPNPLAMHIYPDTWYDHYYLLGRLLGKLIYEQQLAELRFAPFFLAKMQRSSNDTVDIHHLKSYDPILARNIGELKRNRDSVEQLNLDFSVIIDTLGTQQTIELKPNGKEIPVTRDNVLEYIQLLSDFYLNKQLRPMVTAMRAGMLEVLDVDWLRMFDYTELQTLISGTDRDIDVEDLRKHTLVTHPQVTVTDEQVELTKHFFWHCVERMNNKQRQALLKFATGCSRPPLMGFKDLYPPFNVQLTPYDGHLPTASTCMNLLKLPCYPDEETMFDKLVCAIESGAGFELS